MSGIVGRQIETNDPWGGLPPRVQDTPALWVGFPAASASNNVWTTANYFTSTATAGALYSVAPATQIDYARNVNIRVSPNTASSALYSSGGVTLLGLDYYGRTVSEGFAASQLVSQTAPVTGSVNFQRIQTITMSWQFHSGSSSARSDISMYIGQGQKLGLPVYMQSTNAPIMAVYLGTAQQTTLTATASTSNNQYTVVTGAYSVGGISLSSAYASGSLLQIHYKMNGRSTPYEPGRNE